MARIDPELKALLKRIDDRVGDFVYEAGKPLNRVVFSRMLRDKLSFSDGDRDKIRVWIDQLAAASGRPVLDSEAFFKLVRQGASTGEIPDDIPAFLASAPALTLAGRANTVIGDIWDGAVSMVGKAGTAIWENETLRAVAGNGLGVAGAVGFGALIHYMVGSIGPSVPLLTPMFSLMVAVPAAIMAFSAIRQQFPSNDVAAERARSRGAEGPALVRTGGLDGPVLERAAEVRPVTYSRLAGVGDIRPTVGVKLDGDPADISVPVLRSETGAILRG